MGASVSLSRIVALNELKYGSLTHGWASPRFDSDVCVWCTTFAFNGFICVIIILYLDSFYTPVHIDTRRRTFLVYPWRGNPCDIVMLLALLKGPKLPLYLLEALLTSLSMLCTTHLLRKECLVWSIAEHFKHGSWRAFVVQCLRALLLVP